MENRILQHEHTMSISLLYLAKFIACFGENVTGDCTFIVLVLLRHVLGKTVLKYYIMVFSKYFQCISFLTVHVLHFFPGPPHTLLWKSLWVMLLKKHIPVTYRFSCLKQTLKLHKRITINNENELHLLMHNTINQL